MFPLLFQVRVPSLRSHLYCQFLVFPLFALTMRTHARGKFVDIYSNQAGTPRTLGTLGTMYARQAIICGAAELFIAMGSPLVMKPGFSPSEGPPPRGSFPEGRGPQVNYLREASSWRGTDLVVTGGLTTPTT